MHGWEFIESDLVLCAPQAYLAKYGYISSSSGDGRTSALRSLENDIAEFQRFAGLNVTGQSRHCRL